MVDKSLQILEDKLKRPKEETRRDVLEFIRGRFENQLISQGHPYDVVNAVFATGFSDLVKAMKKIEAMETFKAHPAYEPLAVAFKRAGNILKDFRYGQVDISLFSLVEELQLHSTFLQIRDKVATALSQDDYPSALLELAALREPIDRFFGSVMVMVEEQNIRFNRSRFWKPFFQPSSALQISRKS